MATRPLSVPVIDGRYRLAVLRVPEETTETILFLESGPVPGFVTHWKEGKGVYCPGAACPECDKGKDKIWKGYQSALRWCKHAKHWLPTVMEVTESLELDLRDRLERGQVWEVSRGKRERKSRPPCIGRHVKTLMKADIPPAFPIIDVVRWTYHDYDLRIGVHSTIPPRTLVVPVVLEQPKDQEEEREKSKEEWAKQRGKLVELGFLTSDANGTTNGKGGH